MTSMSASLMPSRFIEAMAASRPSGCVMLALWPSAGAGEEEVLKED